MRASSSLCARPFSASDPASRSWAVRTSAMPGPSFLRTSAMSRCTAGEASPTGTEGPGATTAAPGAPGSDGATVPVEGVGLGAGPGPVDAIGVLDGVGATVGAGVAVGADVGAGVGAGVGATAVVDVPEELGGGEG